MYDPLIPSVLHGLKSLSAILAKAESYCESKKIKPEAILNFRLFPDMLPFTSQIQLTSDFAKGIGARLSQSENPKFADVEMTFAELQARISKTASFVQGLDRGLFTDADQRKVKVRISRESEVEMSGLEYVHRFALPNFYFHMTTAYNILRHNGLEIGKGDFMGRNL